MVVYADPERQSSWEVEQCWLTTVPETEREERPLTCYRLGWDWLASLEAIELADGARSWTSWWKSSPAGSSTAPRAAYAGCAPATAPDLAYATTGQWPVDATSSNAPPPHPPRLMWWTLPDNIIELGCVAVHDDMQLR